MGTRCCSSARCLRTCPKMKAWVAGDAGADHGRGRDRQLHVEYAISEVVEIAVSRRVVTRTCVGR